MSRRLESFDFGLAAAGRPRRYPWHEWTDGSVWEIVQGEDYNLLTENMQVNLHMRAAKEGKRVQTRRIRENGSERLVFQFLHEDADVPDVRGRAGFESGASLSASGRRL